MTNRERFLELLPGYKYFPGEKDALKTLSPELFVKWMTYGGYHLSDAFYYFEVFCGFGYRGMNDARAVAEWLEEDSNDSKNNNSRPSKEAKNDEQRKILGASPNGN